MRPVPILAAALLLAAHLLAAGTARAAGDDWDALSRAVGEADPDAVAEALRPGRAWSHAADMAVLNGLVSACGGGKALGKAVRPMFAELIRHGYDLNRRDERDNTLLITAAQTCEADVVEALLDLGAEPGPVNKQDFTPLQMALVSGKWDMAAVLVDHGARITKAQVDQLFMEKPAKTSERALLDRATRP